jgi:uncharacterized protein (UPF0276 family)
VAEPPGVLLERDDDFPPEEKLIAELPAIAAAAVGGRGRQAEPARTRPGPARVSRPDSVRLSS